MITVVERARFPGVGYVRCYYLFLRYSLNNTDRCLLLYQPHGNDVLPLSKGQDFTDYFINFVTTLDPNGGSGSNRTIPWPRYDVAGREMLLVLDGETPLAIGRDDAREVAMDAIVALSLRYPL